MYFKMMRKIKIHNSLMTFNFMKWQYFDVKNDNYLPIKFQPIFCPCQLANIYFDFWRKLSYILFFFGKKWLANLNMLQWESTCLMKKSAYDEEITLFEVTRLLNLWAYLDVICFGEIINKVEAYSRRTHRLWFLIFFK